MYKKNYIVLIGILGTAFEWLEYSYYGYLTTKISQLFFPHIDQRAGLLAAFGIFAAGFMMRPLGGIFFGWIGDQKGRKTALFISLLLMGCASLLMGLLPTYNQVGLYAPFLLLGCRLLQGLAVAGEYNGAAIFLIEHCTSKYPTLAGSWVGTASALGMLLGTFAASIVSHSGMPDWAWRIPFFFACISCLIANYLRYRMVESPLFLTAYQRQEIVRFPLADIFKKYKLAFFKNVVIAAFVSVYIYICNVYFVSYLIKDLHFAASDATLLAAMGELFVVICFPFAAYLSDCHGHAKVMVAGLVSAMIATPLLFFAAKTSYVPFIIGGQILFGLSNAFACAPIFNFIYKLFPTPIRYTGNSTAWSIGVALFGGTAPLVANYLMQHFSIYGPSFYVELFILASLLIVTNKKFLTQLTLAIPENSLSRNM